MHPEGEKLHGEVVAVFIHNEGGEQVALGEHGAADGKLSEEEFALCRPLFSAFFGENVDFSTCKKAAALLKPESRELKKCVNDLVDMLGKLSDDLKEDVILICMMLCAIDGKISLKEKRWIKQLIK